MPERCFIIFNSVSQPIGLNYIEHLPDLMQAMGGPVRRQERTWQFVSKKFFKTIVLVWAHSFREPRHWYANNRSLAGFF